MRTGILYKGGNSLAIMESLEDKSYDMIYLDPPWCIANNREWHYSATQDEDLYGKFMSHLIENAYRLLSDDGILCFRSPSKEYVDINYRLMLDQFFKSSMNVTLERSFRHIAPVNNAQHGNHDILYFYAKRPGYDFPVLREYMDVGEFLHQDDFDYYKRASLSQPYDRPKLQFEWNGCKLDGKSWKYPKEKLDELQQQGRIEIVNHKAYLKQYRREHPIVVSSVWKDEDKFKHGFSIGSKSYERIFTITVPNGGNVLCPYDRDGKFSLIADERELNWTAVYLPVEKDPSRNFIDQIPTEDYEETTLLKPARTIAYRDDIVKNIGDIDALKEKVGTMLDNIHQVQSALGIDETDEVKINDVIDKIHDMTQKFVVGYGVGNCVPIAKEWLAPCWMQLETDSKKFLPTGILFSQFGAILANQDNVGMEMTPIVIEYCKTLENELFEKIYRGYVNDLLNRRINVKEKFITPNKDKEMGTFLYFLKSAVMKNKNNPSTWHLELGKMIAILRFTLVDKKDNAVINDFREYLMRSFKESFFCDNFMKDLTMINILRNDCAHSTFVDMNRAETGKDIIRNKLMIILINYK